MIFSRTLESGEVAIFEVEIERVQRVPERKCQCGLTDLARADQGRVRAYDMLKLPGGPDVIGKGAASTIQLTDAIAAGDTTALHGWKRLADGVWESPHVADGYAAEAADVLPHLTGIPVVAQLSHAVDVRFQLAGHVDPRVADQMQ